MANRGSYDPVVERVLREDSVHAGGSSDDGVPVSVERGLGSRRWPLWFLLLGGIVHTIARSGSYLGFYGNFVQDMLVTTGLLLAFAPAFYVLWRSLGRPVVRRMMFWGIACGLIHLALNLGDGAPLLMDYWLFNDHNAIHVVLQEVFSSAAFALLAGGFYYSIVSYQMSEVAVALERDLLRVEVDEHEHTEEVLREREETFRALAENSFDTIVRFDKECRYLYVNPIVEAQTGIPPSAFIGKTHAEMGFPEGLAGLSDDAIRKVFETRRPNRIESQLPAGSWMDWLLVPEFDKTGEAGAVLGSARDITERKRVEEQQRHLETQLAQAQKLESVGRLAGGVAHDFNNLLTVILGCAEMALANAEALRPDVRKDVQQIQDAAKRGRGLTRQLLAFARKQTLEMKSVNLNEVIVNFEKMIGRLIGEDVQVKTVLNPGIGTVEADTAQIEQVLLNLAVNARDAMPNGGCLTVETANVVLDDIYAEAHPDVDPGAYVMLAVSDTGCGMNAETLGMVFGPFFTTKGREKGTGLGLATVYGIVKQHHGHISVYSEVGIGTTFRVYVPREAGAGQVTVAPSAPASPIQGLETILVVEDDESVRRLTHRMLASLGYDVIEAGCGGDAIRLAASRPTIHLLLSDVIMREMNGSEVCEQVALLHPEIKTLYMSGYTADVIARHGVLDQGVYLLQKPFTREDLAQKIRDVLGG